MTGRPFQDQAANTMYRPQQVEVMVQLASAVQDGQLTPLETQRITNAGLAFGLSLIFGTVLGVLMRSVLAEALEPKEEKAVQPVIDFMLPDAGSPSLLPLVIKCAWCGKYLGEKEPYEDKSVTHGICPECREKYFPKKDNLSQQTCHAIPRDELKRIVEKYGWWAARQAEALCPYGDITCVEREAKRLHEVVRQRRSS